MGQAVTSTDIIETDTLQQSDNDGTQTTDNGDRKTKKNYLAMREFWVGYSGLTPYPGEQLKLEAQLLENERQLETIGSLQSVLDSELEILREVLANPQRYISVEKKQLRLSTMNVVLDKASTDVASDVAFSLAKLSGTPALQRAFVMSRLARSDLPEVRMNFAEAQRYL